MAPASAFGPGTDGHVNSTQVGAYCQCRLLLNVGLNISYSFQLETKRNTAHVKLYDIIDMSKALFG
jgi:hypothetical protein